MQNDRTDRCDVVIVGAGPVGLCLGLWLARRGRDVVVLEKHDSTARHSRAPAIWPATQEILGDLGVIEALSCEGIVVPQLQLFDVDQNRTLFSAPIAELANRTRYPHLLILPQSRTEALLRDALERQPSAKLRFACEATGFAREPDGVVVSYRNGQNDAGATLTGRVVVGCDGAKSMVRAAIGAELAGETYAVEAALADVEVAGSEGLAFPRLTTDPSIAVGIRMGKTLWRLILPFAVEQSTPMDQRIEQAVARLLGRPYRVVWQSQFKLHRRLSSSFASGRIALAGDAAHLNSPVGGQGMNAGIKDASLLGPALLATLDGGSVQPIHDYALSRRREIESGVNRFTNRMTRVLLWRRGKMLRSALATAQALMHIPAVRRRVLLQMAML
jgi:2-polyprenyl-6-methoxyphenol hydroxylase-like FAD-dependent oxidoreductase